MHRPTNPRRHRRHSPSAVRPRTTETGPSIDAWELATGLFVIAAIVLPRAIAAHIFIPARDIVIGTAVFEGAMALPAVCAMGAAERAARWQRLALLALGTFGYLIAVANWVVVDGSWMMLPQGLWILAGRMRRPQGVEGFGSQHCASIGYQTGTGWACFAVGMLLLMGLGQLFPRHGVPGEAHPAVYALVWGGFYVALSLLMPRARARALRPL